MSLLTFADIIKINNKTYQKIQNGPLKAKNNS